MSSSEPFPLLAKTFTGLESVLAEELAGLGARDVAPGRRMVAFSGDQELLYRANLCCRTAVRILKPLGTFELDPAQDAARALYAGLEQFDWSRWLDASGTLTIDPVVHNSPLANSLYAAQVAKDAIADWFRTRYDRRPSVERHEPDLRINLHIDARRVTVYLDASDQSLHKRGYRGAAGEAPLNEVLAAGILRLAGWDGSGTSGDAAPLVDFMCGSGTLPIEAALIAANIAPGLVRKQFGYMRWPDFDRRLHERLLDEARRARRSIEPGLIFGSDIDERAIAAATAGAARAGVGGAIQFSVGNFEAIVPPAPSGTLVFNPAYDERLKVERIAAFYRRIGDVLKRRWSGYTAWMFTGNLVAAKQIGLRTAARIPLNNGPIECRLLKFPLFALASAAESQAPPPAPELPAASAAKSATGPADEPALTAEVADTDLPAADSPEIAEPDLQDSAPVAPGHPAKPASDQALAEFTNRLRRMGKHWSRWARRQGITCYRIYDRDIPEVPLTIDRYEHQLYIAEHARPHGRTPIEQRLWLARLVQAAGELLGAAAADVFVHGREPADRPQRTRSEQIANESGQRIKISLSNRGELGLPLAEREVRRWIAAEAAGKRFLNLFGRGGAASVFAAAGGAAGTVTIENSPGLAGWSRENLALAGFAEPDHVVIESDALVLLEQWAAQQSPPFDLLLAAPPSGYHRRGEQPGWDPRPELLALLRAVLPLVAPGGKIYFVTSARRFKLEADDLPGTTIRDVTRRSVPPDFQARPPHRCWAIVRAG